MNPWRSLKGLRQEIWVLCACTLINRAGTMVLPFLALYLTRHLGYTLTQAGLALSVYGVGSLVSGPLSGLLCDRLGSLRVMKASLLLSGILLFPLPWIRGYSALLGFILAWAVVTEAFRPANLASLSDFALPEQRRAAFALNRLAINLGWSVGPALGGLIAAVSFPALFLVNGVMTVLSGGVLTLSLRADRALPEAVGTPGQPSAEAGIPAWNNGRYIAVLVGLLPAFLVFCQFMSTLPLFLVRDLGLPESSYGFIITINTAIILALEVPLNGAMAHWRNGKALSLGALLVAIGFGALAFATGFWSAAAAVVVWTFGEMVLLPSSAACVADLSPQSRRGEYMGLYQASFSLALISGPWLGTKILEVWGSQALWGAAFLVGMIASFVFLIVNAEVKR
jgi:predicted MFS family arabinose efflux permease